VDGTFGFLLRNSTVCPSTIGFLTGRVLSNIFSHQVWHLAITLCPRIATTFLCYPAYHVPDICPWRGGA
jgi:hypothetical protein